MPVKAGRVPLESFFGPTMDLSQTASRFDNSISWLAAIGNEAALSTFEHFGADVIFARNAELATKLREAAHRAARPPVELPARITALSSRCHSAALTRPNSSPS